MEPTNINCLLNKKNGINKEIKYKQPPLRLVANNNHFISFTELLNNEEILNL